MPGSISSTPGSTTSSNRGSAAVEPPPSEIELNRSSKSARSKKRPFDSVRNEFEVQTGSFNEGGEFRCAHCKFKIFKWKIWNASKARKHLLECQQVPFHIRVDVSGASQAERKKVKSEEEGIPTSSRVSITQTKKKDRTGEYEAKTNSAYEKFKKVHADSIKSPARYWGKLAKEMLDWDQPFDSNKVLEGDLTKGNVRWFAGGKLNMAHNSLDRHDPKKLAIIWEGNEPEDIRQFTYGQVLTKVAQISNALKAKGVKKGDVVTIYMPMVPELAMSMLACARIGAIHSVVFAGFSAEALQIRLLAAQSKCLITADIGIRGTDKIPLKDISDQAIDMLLDSSLVENVLVWERYYKEPEEGEAESDAPYEMKEKDTRMDVFVKSQRPFCVSEPMDAEDTLFVLYTSGSTSSMLNGLVHTTGGYALYAMHTTQTTFDFAPGDRFACTADCGLITGHTYVVYGPLLNGSTTVMFESTPMYPDAGRYWDMVQRHEVTQFHTTPTTIRSLMRFGDSVSSNRYYTLSSLRILGSFGEPIHPDAWRWYYEVIGKSQCTIVDTYCQTMTGGHIISNLPGVTPMKPGSCALPGYGIDPIVLNPTNGRELTGNNVEGVLAIRQPWPGMARTCLGAHERYMSSYLKQCRGYYVTEDSVLRDRNGFYFITGRVDDAFTIGGHRLGTVEVENALVAHPAVTEAAVVAKPHPIKGQTICAFCTLDVDHEESEDLIKELRHEVTKNLGPFADPEKIIITSSLPMTRPGKIMRRILRKIVSGEISTLGDTSALWDPSIVDDLIEKVGDATNV